MLLVVLYDKYMYYNIKYARITLPHIDVKLQLPSTSLIMSY